MVSLSSSKAFAHKMLRRVFSKLLLLLVFCHVVYAHPSNGQDILERIVSLTTQSEKMTAVLNDLERQTGAKFVFSSSAVKKNQRVSVSASAEKLSAVLQKILKPFDISYEVIGDRILLQKRSTKTGSVSDDAVPQTIKTAVSVVLPVEFIVSGKVTDSEGRPLIGATVALENSNKGAVTDGQGSFSFAVADAEKSGVLLIRLVGYESQRIPLEGRGEIAIVLQEGNALEQVVVVGYGTQRKRDVTGSISQVKGDEIKGLPVTSLDQAMQGKAAGVQVTQNSGEPGGSVSVRIRGVGTIGSNEPLYIVDGLPTGSLNAINPNDIESIEILKDAASASIYGSRGANGVVIVTTKRGAGGRTQVNLDVFAGVQGPARKIDVLNSADFATLANESVNNANSDPRATVKNNPLNPLWANPQSLPNYDWQDAIFQNSPVQSYNLSLSGGTEKSRTAASFGYFQQEGLIVNSKYDRFTARLNSDYELNKRARFGYSLNISRENKRSVPTDRGFDGMLQTAYQMHPMQPIFAEDGVQSPTVFGLGGFAHFPLTTEPRFYPRQLYNPIYGSLVRENERIDFKVLSTLFGEYTLLKGLTYRSSIGVEVGNSGSKSYTPLIRANIFGNTTRDEAGESMDRSYSWNWINTLNFNQTFGKHAIGALAGIDALKSANTYVGGNANTFANSSVRTFGFTLQTNRNAFNGAGDFALLSYLGRVNYAFNDRYLFQFNVRRDGSANFGPENRFGVFPSVAVGWRVSEENFMKNVPFISDLKLRASWGKLGNQSIPNFRYINTLSSNEVEYSLGTGAQAAAGGIRVTSLSNPSIKWEATTQIDIGLDASLLDGKVNITADYYERETSDMLVNIPVPITLGAPNNSILRNAGGMKNSGIELSVGYRENRRAFKWSADVNFTTLKNEVVSLGEGGKPIVQNFSEGNNNAATSTAIGQPIAYFWGFKTDGIFQTQGEVDASPMKGTAIPGDRRYVDTNGDGKIDGTDRVNLGNGLPEFILGATLRASFKGFDASILIQGEIGAEIANNNRRFLYDLRNYNGQGVQNVSTDMLNRWTGPGTSNTMPRVAYVTNSDNNRFSDAYIENGSFLRCRNIQIGYTFPQNFSRKIGTQGIRIYVSGQNIFTITDYSGFDPEIGSREQNALNTGTDQGRYPVARMVMGGFNISF